MGQSLTEEELSWRTMVGTLYSYYSNHELGEDYLENEDFLIPVWMHYNKW